MTEDEIKSVAINHLYCCNPDFSKYSEEDATAIKEEIKRIQDDRGNDLYDRWKDEGHYERRFNFTFN